MAFFSNLSSSPSTSNLYHHHQPLCYSSVSPSPVIHFSPTHYSFVPITLNCSSLSTQLIRCCVLQDPNPPELQNPPSKSQKPQDPNPESTSLAKNIIWVNPKTRQTSELWRISANARYSFLLKLIESLNCCKPIEEDVGKVLSQLGENPIEADAVVVISRLENPETAVLALDYFAKTVNPKNQVTLYTATLNVFKKVKDLERTQHLFEEMLERGVEPNIVTFTTIITCARACFCPSKAVEWFERMSEFGCEPNTNMKAAMIDAYGQMGDFNKSLDFYTQARKEKWRGAVDVHSFATVMDFYTSSGNHEEVLKVYRDMKPLGMKPNLTIYNKILEALAKSEKPWKVKVVFKEMTDRRISPNYSTYAALIRAYSKALRVEDALRVYKEIKEEGLQLELVLYNSLLALCACRGCINEGIEIFEDMKRPEICKPDSSTFSSVIDMYASSGNVAEAKGKFKEMLEAGFKPNIHLFTSLIQCYGKANMTDDVLRTFDLFLESGITPDDNFCTCLLIVMNQTPNGECGKLCRCIEKVNTRLGYVVKLLVEEDSSEKGFREEAAEFIESINTDVRKVYCNSLIDLCVKFHLLERACELLNLGTALEIYKDIQSKSPTTWSLNLKKFSLGAALTALHGLMNDLSKALDNGDELPPLLGIDTGRGKISSGQTLASSLASNLRELNIPFREVEAGLFVITKDDVVSWLKLRKSAESVCT